MKPKIDPPRFEEGDYVAFVESYPELGGKGAQVTEVIWSPGGWVYNVVMRSGYGLDEVPQEYLEEPPF